MNAASTLILTIFVTRVCGAEDAGILSIAISVSYVLATVGNFEVRPFQSTDIEERFSFSTYLFFRLFSCTIMMILAVLYISVYGENIGYSPYKSMIILFICIYRMLGVLSDVFQGLFQQNGRMDWAGKALFFYTVSSVVIFLIVLFVTKSLPWASVSMLVAVIACLFLFDFRYGQRITSVHPKKDITAVRSLFFVCLPLFLALFMNMYENNAAKFQIDLYYPNLQAYWTPLFMPAFMINLFSLFLFRPLLTSLTNDWNKNRLHAFATQIGKFLLAILFITIVCLASGFFFGIPVLQLLYGLGLSSYRSVLMLVLVGGGFNAVSVLLYYIVIIMRMQKHLLVCEVATFVVTLFITPFFTRCYLLSGAALSYLIVMLVRSVLITAVAVWKFVKKNRKKGTEPHEPSDYHTCIQ